MRNMNVMRMGLAVTGTSLLAACGGGAEQQPADSSAVVMDGVELVVQEATRPAYLHAPGVVEPVANATLSTKLMGAVTKVLVQEGDLVRAGQPLLHIDARDLAAQRARLDAARAEAEAVLGEAGLHVRRMRALYEDGAAPRAQLDAAETAYTRAQSSVRAARAGAAEIDAMASYADVRAPFAGTIVRRMVDPGSFAAPGVPLLVLQDTRSLRITASASPESVRSISRGSEILAEIEGAAVSATVEGVVPGAAGLFTINAIVDNPNGLLPGTGAATLALPLGTRMSIVVPMLAVRRQGDLTGVRLVHEDGVLTRWIRLGPVTADSVEVVSGLEDGDRILIPAIEPQAYAAPNRGR